VGTAATGLDVQQEPYRKATVESLAQSFVEALRSLIAHQSPTAGGYTPSDFPDVDLSQGQLEKLLQK